MAMDKKIKYGDKPVVQGGVDNYLGKQPQVQAPRKWQSSPDKPATELAYITEAEKNLILKANIHGGLEGGPNMGPSGIMSLDSFGDVGGAGASGGDTEAGGGAMSGRGFSGQNTNTTSDRDFDKQKANQRAGLQIAERAQAKNLGYNERANIANRTYAPKTNKFGGVLSGLLGLINPAFGLLSKGLGFLGSKVGDLRGYNEDGTPRTQAEYEAMVADRKTQGRINSMTDRMLAGKTFSQTNLDNLMGMTDRFGSPFGTTLGNIDNVRGSNLRGILNSGVPKGVAPMDVNVPSGIQSIDVGYPSNDLMAGLTKMQQKMLAGPQKNLKNIMGISDQEILNNISPFNDPNDPATLEEVQSFYTT